MANLVGLVQSGFGARTPSGDLQIILLLKCVGETTALVVNGCSLPLYWRLPHRWTDTHVQKFRTILNNLVEKHWDRHHAEDEEPCPGEAVSSMVVENRKNMCGYIPDMETGDPEYRDYIRMEYSNDFLRKTIIHILSKRWYVPALRQDPSFVEFAYVSEEAVESLSTKVIMIEGYHFPSTTLFQIKYDVRPSRWLEVPRKCLSPEVPQVSRLTRHCHREYEVQVEDIIPRNDIQKTADLIILSFDIETYSPTGSFPCSTLPDNTVTHIGVRVTRFVGNEVPGSKSVPLHYVVLCLGKTSLSKDVEIRWFNDEARLLLEFAKLVNGSGGVDLIVSFNGNNFDWPYIINRAMLFRYFGPSGGWHQIRNPRQAWKSAHSRWSKFQRICERAKPLFERYDNQSSPVKERGSPTKEKLRCMFVDAMTMFEMNAGNYAFKRCLKNKCFPNPPEEIYILAEYRTFADLISASCYFGSSTHSMDPFFRMGRQSGKTFSRVFKTSQNDLSDPKTKGIQIPLVINLDLLQWFKENCKYESYGLGFISQKLLGKGKLPMGYQEMFDIIREGDPDKLRTVAEYCAIDAALLEELIEKKQILTQKIQMSRASRTMIDKTIGGQQRLCWNILHATSFQELNVIPNIRALKKRDYVGAVVLEPNPKGFTAAPVLVLDFQSLYPSIMQAYNIGYSSIVDPEYHEAVLELEKQGKVELIRTHTGGEDHLFVHHTLCHETKPERIDFMSFVERRLKKLRCSVKADMKKLKKKMKGDHDLAIEYANLDALQLALKLLMNSMYGLAGASVGLLPDWRVASSITDRGRWMINQTKLAAQRTSLADLKRFAPQVSPVHRDLVLALPDTLQISPRVIYGDTDSVFVRLGPETQQLTKPQIWAIGEVMADQITGVTFEYEPEVILEMEKFYLGFMLIVKKKYVGWVFKAPNQETGEHGGKGTLAVRRDTIPFQKTMYNDMRDIMFSQGLNPEEIRAAVLKRFNREIDVLCSNQANPEDLIQKKKINKSIDEYPIPPPHVAVAAKIRNRHARGEEVYGVAAYQNGDYVPYVIVMPDSNLTTRQRKALRKGDMAEDPTYWSHNRDKILLNIPVYLDKLAIHSELVSDFIDPDTMHGMLEARKKQFMRKYQGIRSIEDFIEPGSKRRRMENTVRSLKVQVKRKKNPIGASTSTTTQPKLKFSVSNRVRRKREKPIKKTSPVQKSLMSFFSN